MPISSLFVSIFGPDGSGKSTQARILANYLSSRGFSVKIAWIRSYHTVACILSEFIARLSPHAVTLNTHGDVIRLNRISAGSAGRLMWTLIEFASLLPLVIFRVYLPLSMGNVVIAERYLPDSIVSIAYTLNNPDFDSCFVSKTMLRLIPRNSILIYLDSSYEEVKKRRGVMTDPEDFLRFQREMYERLSKRTKAVKIDTAQQSVEGTAKIIRSLLRCHK